MSNNLHRLHNNENFAILANFARSFDCHHNDSNRIHLISSLCLIKPNEMSLVNEFLKNYSSWDDDEMFYVFIISPNSNNQTNKDITYKDNLCIIQLTINELISHLGFTDKNNQIFENVFGDLNLKFKKFDVISQQSIFIFIDQMWSNILLNFKINKVDISGGSTPKRHILQTVDYQLVLHMLKIFKDRKIIKNMIYNSFSDPILSSSVPLNYYENFLNNIINIYNIKVKDIEIIPSIIKNSINNNESELFNNNYLSYVEIVTSNFRIAIEMLVMDIINSIKYDLDKLNNTKNVYSSDLNSFLFKKSSIENIDSISTS